MKIVSASKLYYFNPEIQTLNAVLLFIVCEWIERAYRLNTAAAKRE